MKMGLFVELHLVVWLFLSDNVLKYNSWNGFKCKRSLQCINSVVPQSEYAPQIGWGTSAQAHVYLCMCVQIHFCLSNIAILTECTSSRHAANITFCNQWSSLWHNLGIFLKTALVGEVYGCDGKTVLSQRTAAFFFYPWSCVWHSSECYAI